MAPLNESPAAALPQPAPEAGQAPASLSTGAPTGVSPALAEPLGDWLTARLFLLGFLLLGLIVVGELLGSFFR